jgi:hypothetical protein
MSKQPEFDVEAAHRYFAAECFNRAWDLIDKPERSPEEDERMVELSLASAWHWSQRPDCTPENRSVGYWQVSRVYALLGRAGFARRYGQLSLAALEGAGDRPFYLGYAYEALARAESVAGHAEQGAEYLALARQAAERVPDAEDRAVLLADLETIG